jgi:hypothetical protein
MGEENNKGCKTKFESVAEISLLIPRSFIIFFANN